MLLVAFSLSACAIQRPNSDVCIINAPSGWRKCYNLRTDYDDNGILKKDAKPTYRLNPDITYLNKALVIDSSSGFEDGIAFLKTYINQLRDRYEQCKVE